MRSTIEISASLAQEAKALARREGTTLHALLEADLRHAIRRRRRRGRFRLRDARFEGRGLQLEYRGADWARMREAVYEDRGG